MPNYVSLIQAIESPDRKLPQMHPGDTVKVHVRIIEGNRERIQVFQGMVIRMRGGSQGETFTVRRVSHNVGVERTFLLRSPRLDKIEIVRSGKVRRAQLYYMRGLSGKASRLKERRYDQPGAAAGTSASAPVESDDSTSAE